MSKYSVVDVCLWANVESTAHSSTSELRDAPVIYGADGRVQGRRAVYLSDF